MSSPAAFDDVPVSPRLSVVGPPGADRIAALEDEITTLAGHLAAATARFCRLLADFDAAGGWQAHGLRSCAQWLSWKCGMSVNAAREHVRVAQSMVKLPVVTEAFAAGRLSFSKVRAITRVATPATEAELVETAQVSTASQLDRICSGIKRVRTDEEVVEHRARAKFSATWRPDGMLSFSGCLSPEDGATLLAALAALKTDPVRRETGPAAPEGRADDLPDDRYRDVAMLAARADSEAMVMMARHSLDSPPQDAVGGPVRLIVHATVPAAAGPAAGSAAAEPAAAEPAAAGPTAAENTPAGVPLGAAFLDGGPSVPLLPLSPSTLERLACGAVVEDAADPDSRERPRSRKRFANSRQRRALLRRDGGCRFAGCTRKRGLHAHHVVHFSHGGPTTMANLVLLCDHHHLLVHEGGWRLEPSRRGWVAVRPDGRPHLDAPPNGGDAHELPRAHPARIRPGTVTGNWAGESLDLPYAVGTLVGRTPRSRGRRTPGNIAEAG